MDTWEAIKVVFERVRVLDPEYASKMVGMLLVKDNTENEMIRLALGPDHLIHAFVARARAELAATPTCSSPPVLIGPVQAAHPWGRDGGGGEVDDDCWSPVAAARRHLRRSLSLSDATISKVGPWKPCVYFARGFCKNGSSCRFLHDLTLPPRHDDGTAPPQQLVEPAAASPLLLPTTPNGGGLNFMLQQQQGELQRSMLLGGGEQELMSRSVVHSPRIAMDRTDLMMMMNSPAARQIYLTFPADSTFTEEDVSNYFSMYGPVQDVRIPYQQKRMFGFVTFVYPETVKIILSKGNPHFVCDARVLVKPYKEKGKVPDRVRRLQSPLHDEYPRRMTPTGLQDSRDSFNLHQPIGPRMMLGDIAIQEAFLRRKLLQGQQQAAELEQAIELQKSRFMGLQLLDLKNRRHHLGSPIGSPMSLLGQTNNGKGSVNGNRNVVTVQGVDNKLNGISSVAMSAPVSSTISAIAVQGKHEVEQKEEGGDGTLKQADNLGEAENGESDLVPAAPNVACGFQESGEDHSLPESLLSSPTKAKASIDNISPHHVASSLFPPTSSLELSPYNLCFFQVPRFTSGHDHEAIGL
ncbi:hypothetical protein QOZ80_9BG0696620 [Eleusine coracana subsp. coracana]|nr:hypothetical protein QOZ80_9BG0696620 [Eleusine coracana subsp. coracana]